PGALLARLRRKRRDEPLRPDDRSRAHPASPHPAARRLTTMSLLGIHFTLMIGPVIAVPAPPVLMESLSAVEVTHSDQGRSGFQLTFQVGRSGPLDLMDYALLVNPLLLRPFNR